MTSCSVFSNNPTDISCCVFGPKCPLKFLIVFSEDEFQQKSCVWWFSSKIDFLQQNARKFPGTLEIKRPSEITPSKYTFYFSTYLLNHLYVILPKEQIYVPFEMFPEFFIESQLKELETLLLYLNAENVIFRRISDSVGHQTSITQTHPGVARYVKHMGANAQHNSVEISYDIPSYLLQIDKTLFFYYDKWQTLIENRITTKKCYDEYVYEYLDPCFMQDDFLLFLKTAGIYVPIPENEIRKCNFSLQYDIFYYIPEMMENI